MAERALVGYDVCTPERVGEDLAQALAALLCRGLEHPAGAGPSCADCLAAGRALAPPVGRVLFACRRAERIGARERPRPLAQGDYEIIGRSVELLEQLAGRRASSGA